MSVCRNDQRKSEDPGNLKSPGDDETAAQSKSLDSRLGGNDGVLSACFLSFPRRRESRNRLHRFMVDNRIQAFSGFTLFELLVVVLIIGLTSAFVMPRMAASLPGVQLKSTTRAVAASLRYARSKAVSETRPYVAIFDNTQKMLVVEPFAKPTDAAESNSLREILNRSQRLKVYEIPDEIGLVVVNNNAAVEDADLFPIFFFPRGDSSGAKIVLQNPRRKQYTVTVDRITGSVEIAFGGSGV